MRSMCMLLSSPVALDLLPVHCVELSETIIYCLDQPVRIYAGDL